MPGIFTEYCGPDIGIWKGTGIPRDTIDALCKKHDQRYNAYLKAGYNPYLAWNRADDAFLKDVKKNWRSNVVASAGAITWFEFKRVWSNLTGTIHEGTSFFILHNHAQLVQEKETLRKRRSWF